MALSYVGREGNDVAHNLAKYQPFEVGTVVWLDYMLESIMDLALNDLCLLHSK